MSNVTNATKKKEFILFQDNSLAKKWVIRCVFDVFLLLLHI